MNNPLKTFQGRMLKEQSKNKTENVSTACEVMVEKLLRNQSILPLVNFFQK